MRLQSKKKKKEKKKKNEKMKHGLSKRIWGLKIKKTHTIKREKNDKNWEMNQEENLEVKQSKKYIKNKWIKSKKKRKERKEKRKKKQRSEGWLKEEEGGIKNW